MKNKKGIIIFALIIAILIIVGIIAFSTNKKTQRTTGNFGKFQFELGNYMIEGNTTNGGAPSKEYDFCTYYGKLYNMGEKTIDVDAEINIKAHNDLVYNDYSNYDDLESMKIFRREFKYIKEDDKITFIYKHRDDLFITIDVVDDSICYDEQGNQTGIAPKDIPGYDFWEILNQDVNFLNAVSMNIQEL